MTVFNASVDQMPDGETKTVILRVLAKNYSGKTATKYSATKFEENYEKSVRHYAAGESPAKKIHKLWKQKSRDKDDIEYTDDPTEDQIIYIKTFLLNNESASKLDPDLAVNLREELTQFGLGKATRVTMARAKRTVDAFYQKFAPILEKINALFEKASEGKHINDLEIEECIEPDIESKLAKIEVHESMHESTTVGADSGTSVAERAAAIERRTPRASKPKSPTGVPPTAKTGAELQPRIVLQFL